MMPESTRTLTIACRVVGGLTIGCIGTFIGIILGTFGDGMAEEFIGHAAIPFGIAIVVISTVVVSILVGVRVGSVAAKLITRGISPARG
jgi:hypothetical protein